MFGLKNLFALVGLVVVAFAGAGWYLGWYKIGQKTDAQGHPQLQIQVNPGLVKSDLDKAKEKIIDTLEKHHGAPVQIPGTTPGQSNTIPPMPPPPPTFEFPALPSIPQSIPLPQAQSPQQPTTRGSSPHADAQQT